MGKRNKSQNDMMDRQSFQQNETYPRSETGLPADRFQNDVQVAVADETVTKGHDFIDDTGKSKSGSESIVARTATAVKKKMAIKPTSDTELEEGKIVGGVPLGDSAAVMSVAGALPIGISTDQSRVPYARGGGRSTERYGKKISTDNFIINNVVSEQIKPTFDEPKDLREAPEALQGYNGRKQFTTARGKKVYGDHPASTLYERSIDFVDHSAVVSSSGQILGSINQYSGYPILSDEDQYNVQVTKSNFLLNAFNLTLTDGHISAMSFDETQIVVPDGGEAQDQANMNWQVDANNVAKAMVKLQTELGRETTDKWSPLGYVIDQPYQFGMLFHDGEEILGSLTGAAYHTAAHSLAFLQNRMAKEGVRGVASIAEWLGEDLAKAANPTMYDKATTETIFNSAAYNQGSAAAIIAMFDSPAKYTTKADFINQPRSFKFHLQTVDNNINPFHAKKTFYAALDKAFLFSTEDGSYSPVLPVHVTNEVKVMVPYSLNAWLQGWSNPYLSTPIFTQGHGGLYATTGITRSAHYSYNDLRNTYDWEYVDPFVAGLCKWLLRHEAALVKAYGRNATIRMPIHFTNTTGNMFSFLVCSASQDMAWMRNVIFRDYLFAGDQGVYVWDDLASLTELNPLYSSQYRYKDYGSALELGSMSKATKIRLYWPEIISLRESYYGDTTSTGLDNTAVAGYYLPFYFNENAIDPTAISGIDVDSGAIMSYPIIRAGVNHEFTDLMYSLSEREVRLCLDRMVTIPVDVIYAAGVATGYHHANQFHFSSLRYDDNSDGRVVMTAIPGNDFQALRELTYLATPRELGFLFPLPVSCSKPYRNDDNSFTSHTIDCYITGATPESIISYHALGNLAAGTVIDRSASLSQTWIRCFADCLRQEDNDAFVAETGIAPSISCFLDAQLEERGTNVHAEYILVNSNLYQANAVYNLRSADLERVTDINNQNPTHVGNNTVFSLARFIWPMIQRLYSPINPFDGAWLSITDGGATVPLHDGVCMDPLEVATYFGFAGCLESDFNQDVLDRLTKKDQLGMFYYEDEFIKSSLIFSK